jgi:hypothetical protein
MFEIMILKEKNQKDNAKPIHQRIPKGEGSGILVCQGRAESGKQVKAFIL